MKRLSLIFGGLLLAALPSTTALADTFFDFSFSGSTFSGSGVFDTVAATTAGEYTVVGVTGTTNTGGTVDRTISSLIGRGGFQANDNELFFPALSTGAFFDINGFSYMLDNGAEVNLFGLADEILMRVNGREVEQTAPITITEVTPSAVPEPGSIALLGTGALGMIGVVRRRLAL